MILFLFNIQLGNKYDDDDEGPVYGQCKNYAIFSNAVRCFLYSVESVWRVVILGANYPLAMYTTRFL